MTASILLAQLFVEPLTIGGLGRLLMLLPLAAAISIVYKTIHTERLRDLPLAGLTLWITIVAAMISIGVVLLIIFRLLA